MSYISANFGLHLKRRSSDLSWARADWVLSGSFTSSYRHNKPISYWDPVCLVVKFSRATERFSSGDKGFVAEPTPLTSISQSFATDCRNSSSRGSWWTKKIPGGSFIGRWTISIGIGPRTYHPKYPLYTLGASIPSGDLRCSRTSCTPLMSPPSNTVILDELIRGRSKSAKWFQRCFITGQSQRCFAVCRVGSVYALLTWNLRSPSRVDTVNATRSVVVRGSGP